MMQPLSPADCCLRQPLPFVWQFPQNALTYGNGIDQTSKLEGIKHQLTLQAFAADPTAAGVLRLSCFPV